jgi:hypothetical protein
MLTEYYDKQLNRIHDNVQHFIARKLQTYIRELDYPVRFSTGLLGLIAGGISSLSQTLVVVTGQNHDLLIVHGYLGLSISSITSINLTNLGN